MLVITQIKPVGTLQKLVPYGFIFTNQTVMHNLIFEKKHNKPWVPIIGIPAVMPKPLTPKVLTEILQTFMPDFKQDDTKQP